MNYDQVLDYMFSQLPMFHRVGAPAYKANLDNTIALSEATGLPQKLFKTVHIAGTNGKGSVSHMIASALQESGLKTGLFTSPHLEDFRERIKVNGEMVSKDYITSFINNHLNDFATIQPSFFEMTFALAMRYFADVEVDIAVVETGMGGRLDSTNIIEPEISIITNIGYDHMQFLGNTLKAIATEKAGIIKAGVPVVIGESNPETDDVFIGKAKELDCNLIFADKAIQLKECESQTNGFRSWLVSEASEGIIPDHYYDYNGLEIVSPLTGDYQEKNIKTAIAAAGLLKRYITNAGFINGIKNTLTNTGFQGRWQILAKNPLTVCDIGHNTHGLVYVASQINKQKFNKLHFVLGAVNDKDITSMLSLLPPNATYYYCKPDIPRGLDSKELKKLALETGLQGIDCTTVEAAYNKAFSNADKNDMIFIGGSTFVVAEVLPLFNRR